MSDERIHDDDEAVRFIRNCLPQEMKENVSDDDILYIIDVIYDFYDVSGFLDEDGEEDDDATVEIDEDLLIQYVEKSARKDGVRHFALDEIALIVQGELAYCESIHLIE
ncbi:MAG: hypothetical protein LBS42_07715 [Tannerella sp.]|jgi:hypothetical protein|nr:hypothetical protein [Tannerella sp.]